MIARLSPFDQTVQVKGVGLKKNEAGDFGCPLDKVRSLDLINLLQMTAQSESSPSSIIHLQNPKAHLHSGP